MTTLRSAGYIVANNEAIHGFGATADAAWADFRAQMAGAHVTVLGEDDDSTEQRGSWARESDFRVKPATAALLATVENSGGAISWGSRDGVACTRDEENEAEG